MSGSEKKKKRLARFLAALLTVVMTVSFPLPFLPHGEAEAAGGTMANLVIFVKQEGDTKDVFNATWSSGGLSYSNWEQIKEMYGGGTAQKYNSFTNYISVITEGNVKVENYFPQELTAQNKVVALEVPAGSYDGDVALVTAVIKAINEKNIILDPAYKLDNRRAGYIDNLTVILQGDTVNGDKTAYHKRYVGEGQITGSGLRVSDYNVIPSELLVADDATIHLKRAQGVIAHEFLHTLGLPDLYRQSGSGEPVGIWDIMASVSSYLQYPLSYLRARQKWIPMETITQSGTYTLTAVSEPNTKENKVFALQTPLSDTEFICLEYRRKNGDSNQFEYSIPSDGLLMYRVDTKVYDLTNSGGKNYIYVYRPGVPDPEAATVSVNGAALDVANGETSYGSTDLNADYAQDTLYYSDGSNSGIQLSNLKLSGDKSQLTFTVTFADYKNAITWENMGGTASSQCIGDPFVCTDSATGTLYAAFLEELPGNGSQGQVCVKRWDGAAWQQVGTKLSPASRASQVSAAVCGGEIYLSYLDQASQPVFCKLENGAWKQIARHTVANPKYVQFVVDGSNIYAAYEDSGRWKIYNLKNNSLVDSQLTAKDFSNPAMLMSNGSFYMIYADFAGGPTKIQKYSGSTWSTVDTLPSQSTNIHQIAKYGNAIYAFAGNGNAGIGGTAGQNAVMAVFDGKAWANYPVSGMEKFNAASMAMAGNQVCLAYYDTDARKMKLLQGNGASFQTISDNLGTGVGYMSVCSHGSSLYIATKALNSTNLVVRKKVISGGSVTPPAVQESRVLDLTPPAGYTDNHVYIDGVEYTAVGSYGNYQLKLPDTSGKTAVMYSYDAKGIPVGMYVWKLSWEGEVCKAVPLPGLKDLLSYHGFSIRVQSPAGIRFKSGIDGSLKQRLISSGVDGYKLTEYGTLFITNDNKKLYPFVKGGTKVGGGRAYWTENGRVNDKVFETVAGRHRFTSVLVNLAPNMYAKDISFRAYAVLSDGGEEIIVYGPPVYRSVYTVAKQVQARGEFKPGSSGYKYVQDIINSVERR